jgi:uncharacterized radical SAM superfamily Fe-S cluster-containing enzyme
MIHLDLEGDAMTAIRDTESICPECLNVLPATLLAEDGKVFMKKTCPDHGEFKDLVWGDYSEYRRIMSFNRVGARLENPPNPGEGGLPLRLRHLPRTQV